MQQQYEKERKKTHVDSASSADDNATPILWLRCASAEAGFAGVKIGISLKRMGVADEDSRGV